MPGRLRAGGWALALLVAAAAAGAGPAAPGAPPQAAPQDKRAPVSFYARVPLAQPEYGFDLAAVSDTSLWYTTSAGLYRFNGLNSARHLDASRFARGLVEVFLVEAPADDDVWVLGHDAQTWTKTMYHFDGTDWSPVPFPQSDADSSDDLVLFRFRVARDSRGDYGVGVGEDGLYYTYDGARWTLRPAFTSSTLRTVEMVARDDMWAAGKGGALYHFDGKAWSEVPVHPEGFNDYILEMSFSSPHSGWAVSTNSLLRYAGGRWTRAAIPDGVAGRTVQAVSPGDAWIFTDNGTVLRYDGIVWNAVAKLPMHTGYASVGMLRDGREGGGYTLYVVTNAGIVSNAWGRLPMFIDVSPSANIHLNGGEVTAADFDGDGSEDLFVSADGRYSDRLYANSGKGLFTEMTDRLHPPGRSIASRAAAADLDNNGHVDIIAHRGLADNLWYANGGSWEFAERPGPVPSHGSSNYSRIRTADMDNDGDLDLVLMPASDERPEESLVVYWNDGVGNFPDSSVLRFRMRAGASPMSFFLADLNADGRTDIFKYNVRERAEAHLNQGDGGFREAAAERGLVHPAGDPSPYVTWAWPVDIDRNGATDVFIVSRKGVGTFLVNDGRGFYTPGDSVLFDAGGENPAGAFSDIDCDGDDDLFLLDRFYENRGGRFSEYRYLGFRKTGTARFSDIDGDGDEDLVFSAMKNERTLTVFENGIDRGNVLTVGLRGIGSNSRGIGSTVRLWRSGAGRERTLENFTEVRSPNAIRFALDTAFTHDLEVRFPGGAVVGRAGVRPGSITVAEFGEPAATFLDLYHSFRRSVAMADLGTEWKKLLVLALAVAGALLYATLKLRTSARANAAFGVLLLAAYVLAVHGTIRSGPAASTIYPLGGAALAATAWIAIRNRVERGRRARRISHYLLGEQLGEGGMGTVFAATDTLTGERVAVKVLNPALMDDPENRKRLIAEGHLLSTIRHPNIVKVHEVGEHLGRGFIAMEFLPGGTVRSYVSKNAPLALPDAKQLATEVCAGLVEIHGRGVVHRDLKSGNIMFGPEGGVRIMDFGLSKSPLVTTMTTLGTILGTLGYVSPEQVTNISVDHRADLFSFGVLLYEMLTGKLPFDGENEMAVIHSIFNHEPPPPSRLNPAVPPRLDAVVLRCLRKNPGERYGSAAELRVDLDGDYW